MTVKIKLFHLIKTIIVDKVVTKSLSRCSIILQIKICFFKGNINIQDINNNKYYFSEIYIDEKRKNCWLRCKGLS